jgi:hypothetical protein
MNPPESNKGDTRVIKLNFSDIKHKGLRGDKNISVNAFFQKSLSHWSLLHKRFIIMVKL